MVDIYDPWDPLARLRRMTMGPEPMRDAPPFKVEPMTPEREKAILPKIGGAALGGLGYVGGSLEKAFGGRAIRGLLGGKPEELLSIIPFSDTWGITDEANRVGSRDLFRQWGLAGDEDTWANFAAGLAGDILTDPGTYLTFGAGAATQAGNVAQKIGQLPKTMTGRLGGSLRQVLDANPSLMGQAEIAAGGANKLAPLMDESLGGLFGFQVPFTNLKAPMLTGQAGLDTLEGARNVGQGIASGHNWLSNLPGGIGWTYKNLTPMGFAPWAYQKTAAGLDAARRYGRSLLDAPVMGAIGKAGQEGAEEASSQILPWVAAERQKAYGLAQRLKALGLDDANDFRLAYEGINQPSSPEVAAIINEMRGMYSGYLDEANRLGLNIKEYGDPWMDYFQYGARYASPPVKMRSGYAPLQALKATDDALQTGRESILEGFQRGTVGINEMVLDQAAHADNALNAAAHIRQKYLMDPEAWVDAQIAAQKMDPANRLREIANTQAYQRVQSAKLAKWIRELPDEFRQSATGGIPERLNFFGNHPLADLMTYIDKFGRMRASGNAAQNLIARNLLDLNAGPLPKGAVTVKDALNRAGLVSEPMGAGGIQPGAHENLLGIINRERLKNLGPVAPLQNLDDLYIPGEIGSELGRYVGSFQAPEAAGKIGSAIDYLTNLFKSHVTRGWPAFHVRNLMSGQGVNIAEGAPGAVGRVGEGFGMVGGKAIPDAHLLPMFAGRNLTPEQATAELGQMVAAYNILGHKANVTRDVIGPAGQALMMPHSLDDVLGAIPGYQPKNLGTVWERLKGGAGTSWNPKNVVNVAGAGTSKDIFPLAAAGAEMGDIIEAANRIPQFTSLLRQGWAPEAAAKKVLASHFDYSASAFTPFERTVMKRLVPFYSYQKNVIPQTLRQLYEQPGGFAGTLARLSYGTRQQGGFLPSYLGDSLAIPLGDQNAEGFRRYLTKIDFAPESAFSFFPGTMGDPVQNSLMSLLGQTNPLFKGPLEYAANRQFHTGRELGDLHAVTGNPLLEHTLANSPVARYMSLFRTATNPQKWDPYAIPLNLLTGVRVSDVDMPKYRDIAEREYVKKALQGLPAISKFENLSVKPELAHTLTPEEIELLQLQRLLEQRAREKKKIRVEGGR